MVFVLDNYDSFTYNLVQYLGELGAEVVVRRNDELTVEEVEAMNPERILLSPGPCTPGEAGILVPLIRHMAGKAPILGVCLGHQAIGEAFGGQVVRARSLMHGKTSPVEHDGKGVFAGLPTPLTCTRYHSLIVAEDSLPAELAVTGPYAGAERGERVGNYGSAPSPSANRRRAVPPRERAHRRRAPDDSQLSGNVAAMTWPSTTRSRRLNLLFCAAGFLALAVASGTPAQNGPGGQNSAASRLLLLPLSLSTAATPTRQPRSPVRSR